jgi:hypothetical protein
LNLKKIHPVEDQSDVDSSMQVMESNYNILSSFGTGGKSDDAENRSVSGKDQDRSPFSLQGSLKNKRRSLQLEVVHYNSEVHSNESSEYNSSEQSSHFSSRSNMVASSRDYNSSRSNSYFSSRGNGSNLSARGSRRGSAGSTPIKNDIETIQNIGADKSLFVLLEQDAEDQ